MTGKDRLNNIRQMIKNEHKVSVPQLSELYQVTEETIRRDLDKLEAEGIANRTYGGAVLNTASQVESIHFYKRSDINLEAKKKIAINALSLLENKSTMFADSSSTVIELLKLMKERQDLTVLTNSSVALQVLATGDTKVLSTGGEFNKNSLSMQGSLAKEMVRKYHVEVCVMSCKGLDLEAGALDSNENEAEVKKIMIEQADEMILLVDHTKFDKKAFVQLVLPEKISCIVTNEKPLDKWVKYCRENNITLLY